MAVYAQHTRKIAGIVLDIQSVILKSSPGCICSYMPPVRRPEIRTKKGRGSKCSVSIGNIAVMPGDIVLGDRDGVIVIPRKDAAVILEEAKSMRLLMPER